MNLIKLFTFGAPLVGQLALASVAVMDYSALVYVPNLIGYVRLILILIGWFFYDNMYVFLPLYGLSAFLDGIDGCVARALRQCSAFGAWLDVLVDNIGRSIIWTKLYSWGVFVACVEWTVFVCTHTHGHQWKTAFGAAPQWVKTVMDNGFYTPVGIFTVSGLHVLPAYLYFVQHVPDSWPEVSPTLLYAPLIVLAAGRTLALAVELWCIKTHVMQLLGSEEDLRLCSLTKDLHSSDASN